MAARTTMKWAAALLPIFRSIRFRNFRLQPRASRRKQGAREPASSTSSPNPERMNITARFSITNATTTWRLGGRSLQEEQSLVVCFRRVQRSERLHPNWNASIRRQPLGRRDSEHLRSGTAARNVTFHPRRLPAQSEQHLDGAIFLRSLP